MKILIASHNKHKIVEIKEILKDLPIEILSGDDLGEIPDVIEDKDTIEGNAEKKALEIAQHTGMLTLADDTGLFVEALDNRPGVYSARYAGENCSYKDNRDKMLLEMKDKENRTACFRTVVAFASPEGILKTAFGQVDGEILNEEKGNKGFGYDPIFKPIESDLTFAEMDDEAKHKISHRGRAFRALVPFLEEYINKNK